LLAALNRRVSFWSESFYWIFEVGVNAVIVAQSSQYPSESNISSTFFDGYIVSHRSNQPENVIEALMQLAIANLELIPVVASELS